MRDWIVNHPTSSQPFNVVFWLGVVALLLRFALGAIAKRK
jgi:hypothetical protein